MPEDTKPPLTTDMLQETKAAGTPPPAAGGWVPSPAQRAMGVGLVSTLGAIAAGAPAAFPGKAGLIAACVCGALALGIAAALGMQSAGPRSLS